MFVSAGANDPGCYAPTLVSKRRRMSFEEWNEQGYSWITTLEQPFGLCEFGHQGLPHEEEIDNGSMIQNRMRIRRGGVWYQRDPEEYQDAISLYVFLKSNPYFYTDPYGEASRQLGESVLLVAKQLLPNQVRAEFYVDGRVLVIPLFPPAVTAELIVYFDGRIESCCNSKKDSVGAQFVGEVGFELSGGAGTSIGGNSGVKIDKRQAKQKPRLKDFPNPYRDSFHRDKPQTGMGKGSNRSDRPDLVKRGIGNLTRPEEVLTRRKGAFGGVWGALPQCQTSVSLNFSFGASGFASAGIGKMSVGAAFDLQIGHCSYDFGVGAGSCSWYDPSLSGSVVTGMGSGARVQVYGRGSASGSVALY